MAKAPSTLGEVSAAAAGGLAASASALLAFQTAIAGTELADEATVKKRAIIAAVASYGAAGVTAGALAVVSRSARDGCIGAIVSGLARTTAAAAGLGKKK